jgi:hypothetical protein
MTGGLIQLVTTGIQDAPISYKPEITFFKTIYKKYTQFSINNQIKFLGTKQFNSGGSNKLDKNGDLLYGQYFKLEIPYFDIIKYSNNTQKEEYNINELTIKYQDNMCIMIYYDDNWYLIPEYLFNLPNLNTDIKTLDSSNLIDNLLPEYITIADTGANVNFIQVKDNKTNSGINIIKVHASYWENYWLDLLCETTDIMLSNTLVTLISYIKNINNSINTTLFNNYYKYNYYNKYSKYFNFNVNNINETKQYFDYVKLNNSDIINNNFDIDIVYNYCLANKLNFNNYIDNTLNYNSLVILFMLKIFYSNPSIIFTFWNKIQINKLISNALSSTLLDTYNTNTEWVNNLTLDDEDILQSSLNNHIYQIFIKNYYLTEQNIISLFAQNKYDNFENIYKLLNIFLSRFQDYSTNIVTQLNFNDFYKTIKYNNIEDYNNNSYHYKFNTQETDYTNPVSIINVYGYIAYKMIDNSIKDNNISRNQINTIIAWCNNVIIRLYNHFINTSQLIQNNKELINVDNNATLYYPLYLNNPYTVNNFYNSFNELFYKSSWIGNIALTQGMTYTLFSDIFKIGKNELTTINDYKNYHKLQITNVYTFHLDNNDFVLDTINNKIIINNYDNHYELNHNIIVTIDNNIVNTSKIRKDLTNPNILELYFNKLLKNIININNASMVLKLIVDYTTFIPFIAFNIPNNQINTITYANNEIKQIKLLSKNSNNLTYNINQFNNDHTFSLIYPVEEALLINAIDNNALLFLNIEYIDKSNIIKPAITTIPSPIINTTEKPYYINAPNVKNIKLTFSVNNEGLASGTYFYIITFSSETYESNSAGFSYNINTPSNIIISNIPISLDNRVTARNIYRSLDGIIYKFITTIYDNKTTQFIDNINTTDDEFINNAPYYEISNDLNSTLISGTYSYLITFATLYDESNYIKLDDVTITSNKTIIIHNIPKPINPDVTSIKIYRNNITTGDYYYLASINANDAKNDDNITYTDNNELSDIKYDTTNINFSLGLIGDMTKGEYKYALSYFSNTDESNAVYISDPIINETGKAIIINNLPEYPDNNNIIGMNIYRTTMNTSTYYLLDKVLKDDYNAIYTDNNQDINLTNNSIPDTNQTYIDILDTTDGFENGLYYYAISYYNVNNESDITILPSSIQITNNTQIIMRNIPTSNDINVIGRKIYRTKANETTFYLIQIITDNVTSVFVDDIHNDKLVDSLLPKNNNIITKIPIKIINSDGIFQLYDLDDKQYNMILNYSIISDINIDIISPMNYSFINNENFAYGGTNITLLSNFSYDANYLYYLVNKTNMCDNIKLVSNKLYLASELNGDINNYRVLKIAINNTTPNLEAYISISTDYFYLNQKNMSEFNDYIFAKPFGMIMNSSDNKIITIYNELLEMAKPYINFYNIPFKINPTSKIKLDDNMVNYILPLTTQQFFIKDTVSLGNYYSISNNINFTQIGNIIYSNGLFNNRISMEFDEFNMIINDINNGTIREQMINIYNDQFMNTINTSDDINNIINLINNIDENINDLFNSLFNNTINTDLYGNTSKTILHNIQYINNFNNILNEQVIKQNNTTTQISVIQNSYNTIINSLPLLEYNTIDYFNYSHFASTNNIFNNIYKPYSASNKISEDVINYLRDISTYFTQHIDYINNNYDYITLTNPQVYSNAYISKNNIIQSIYNKAFTYDNTKTISLIHPIIDNNITNIIYNDNMIDVTLDNQKLTTTDDIKIIQEPDFINSSLLQSSSQLFTNDKFNYLGVFTFIDDDTKTLSYSKETQYKHLNYLTGNYNNNHYIRLLNVASMNVSDHFIIQIKDIFIKSIPSNKYYVWIYPQEYLNTINILKEDIVIIINSNGVVSFNKTGTTMATSSNATLITPNIPEYSFYLLNDVAYYYETGNKIEIVPADYHLTNILVTKFALIDNSILMCNPKQYLSLNTPDMISAYQYYIKSYSKSLYIANIKEYFVSFFKPTIEFIGNYTINSNTINFNIVNSDTLLDNVSYFVVITKTSVIVVLRELLDNNMYHFNTTINECTIYWSQYDPIYIPYNITISKNKNILNLYSILRDDNLYLDRNEIIIINNYIFNVIGLTIDTQSYDIQLIGALTTDIFPDTTTEYTSYYTLGTYMNDTNNNLPDLKMNNLLKYTISNILPINTSYMVSDIKDDIIINKIKFTTITSEYQVFKNIYTFSEPTLNINIICTNTHYYILDNFVKVKKGDKIIYNGDIYMIVYIRGNQFITNKEIVGITDNLQTIINIPYQPFETYYVNVIDNKLNIDLNEYTLIVENINELELDLYPIVNNSPLNTTLLDGYQYIRVLSTKYIKYFNNIFIVPPTIPTLSNQYSVQITCDYDINSELLTIPENLIYNHFTLFYMQPVMYNGIFNNIHTIYYNTIDNTYKFKLVNPILSEITTINLILSPSTMNNYNYYLWYKFKYNYSLQYHEYIKPGTLLNIIEYIIVNDELVNIIQMPSVMYEVPIILPPNINNTNIIENGWITGDISYVQLINTDTNITNLINVNDIPFTYINKLFINDITSNNGLSINNVLTQASIDTSLQVIYTTDENSNNIDDVNNTIFNVPFIFGSNNNFYNNTTTLEYDTNNLIYLLIENKKVLINNVPFIIIDADGRLASNKEFIYFTDNYLLDQETGLVEQNISIVHDTWHQLLEISSDYSFVHLVKIILPNNLKFYSKKNINLNSTFYLDKLILIHINQKNEFTYGIQNIQTINTLICRNDPIDLISTYKIKCISYPRIDEITGLFKQQIDFIGNELNIDIYDTIYLSITSTPYKIIMHNNNYYILSNQYLGNINTIYAKTINYIKSVMASSDWNENLIQHNNNINFTTLYNNIEYNVFNITLYNINLSNIGSVKNVYTYDNLNNRINIPIKLQTSYNILTPNVNIEQVSFINDDTIKFPHYTQIITDKILYDDKLLYDGYNTIPILVPNKISNDLVFDPSRFYNDIEDLHLKLLSNISIPVSCIFMNLKPWTTWSLLNSTNNSIKMTTLLNQGYISDKFYATDNNPYSFITNNELDYLLEFMNKLKIPNNQIYYNIMKLIEADIIHVLPFWLSNYTFFDNVIDNINSFIQMKLPKYIDIAPDLINTIVFDGSNILINNTIPPYITNEFTFDNNKVYRSKNNFMSISTQLGFFINRTYNMLDNFGININNLLIYLVELNIELRKQSNILLNPPNIYIYDYEQPIKYLISILWKKYEKDLTLFKHALDTNIQVNTNIISDNYSTNIINSIYSGITFANTNRITYYGLSSLNNYNEWILQQDIPVINLATYGAFVNILNTLNSINIMYSYSIAFDTNTLNSNYKYALIINNNKIKSDNMTIYNNNLLFTSDYKMNDDDKVIIEKTIVIIPLEIKLLGTIYNITIDSITIDNTLNLENVDSIMFLGKPLIIERIISDNTFNIILDNTENLSTENVFELHYNVIISIKNNVIKFVNDDFYYVENQTFIIIDNVYYLLIYEDEWKINANINISNNNSQIITFLTILGNNIVEQSDIIYEIILSEPINDYTRYNKHDNNILIVKQFSIGNNNLKITPNDIFINNNKLWYYFNNDIVIPSTYNTIFITNNVGQTLPNKINHVENTNIHLCFIKDEKKLYTLSNTQVYFYFDTLPNISNFKTPLKSKRIFFANNLIYIDMELLDLENIAVLNNVNDHKYIDVITYNLSNKLTKVNNKWIISNIDLTSLVINNNDYKYTLTFTENNIIKTLFIKPIQNDKVLFALNNIIDLTKPISLKMYNYNITTLYNAKYIIENSWQNIPFTKVGTIYKINVPNLYINNEKYIYTINNIQIFPSFNNNEISFTTTAIIDTMTINMYYISPLNIKQPEQYMKTLVHFDDKIQYDINNNKYIQPYTLDGMPYKKYLYNFTIDGNLTDTTIDNIIILHDTQNIKTQIFQQIDNTFIIAIDEKIDDGIYTILVHNHLSDNIQHSDNYNVNIIYYQESNSNVISSMQNDMQSIYVYTNNIQPYTFENTNGSYYIISSVVYSKTNKSINSTFHRTTNMKPQITTIKNDPIIKQPIWDKPSKLFEYIRLYIDDQMIEEINEHTLNIIYHLYAPYNKKIQIEKLMKIRQSTNGWDCMFPLAFWFNHREGSSIPLVALSNSNLYVKYKLNNINNIILNNADAFTKEPSVKISLLSDTILLDTPERKLFATYSHEYIITPFKTYGNTHINSLATIVKPKLQGLIKDLIFVSKPHNSNSTAFNITTYDNDTKYQYYLDAVYYYSLFIKDGYITSVIQETFINDFTILENIMIEIKLGASTRYNKLIRVYPTLDIRFLLFLEDKFSISNTMTGGYNALYMYLKYMFKNNKNIKYVSPLDTMYIITNGCDLFTKKNWSYFNHVVPYSKFHSSPPIGYYAYSFALYPLSDQPSGHLNFNHFDDININITSNPMVEKNPYNLIPITREYNILRIMSGIGALAWV